MTRAARVDRPNYLPENFAVYLEFSQAVCASTTFGGANALVERLVVRLSLCSPPGSPQGQACDWVESEVPPEQFDAGWMDPLLREARLRATLPSSSFEGESLIVDLRLQATNQDPLPDTTAEIPVLEYPWILDTSLTSSRVAVVDGTVRSTALGVVADLSNDPEVSAWMKQQVGVEEEFFLAHTCGSLLTGPGRVIPSLYPRRRLAPGDIYRFGATVGISEGRIIVDDSDDTLVVYSRNGDEWVEEARFTNASTGSLGAKSAAIEGDVIVMTVPRNGTVQIHESHGGQWITSVVVTSSPVAPKSPVAVASDRIVVGLGNGTLALVEKVAGTWAETDPIVATGGVPLVAASFDEGTIFAIGKQNLGSSAHAFSWDGVAWTEEILTHVERGSYGRSIASFGNDRAVVGEPERGGVGAEEGSAYVYERDETGWSETRLKKSDAFDYERFGSAVSTEGDLIAVGVPWGRALGSWPPQRNNGLVDIFLKAGPAWIPVARLLPPDPDSHTGFGSSVAVEGRTVVVGAPGEAAAYVFDLSEILPSPAPALQGATP